MGFCLVCRKSIPSGKGKFCSEKCEVIMKKQDKKWHKENWDQLSEMFQKEISGYRRRIEIVLRLQRKVTLEHLHQWGMLMRYSENVSPDFDFYKNYHAHHIFPKHLFPDFALDEWNGAVMPHKWHVQFHKKYLKHRNNPSFDWVGILIRFIEGKLKTSQTSENLTIQSTFDSE